jgi:3-hydroxymyristoyl/3-hydroxydecanoyl-(acyl carrier protein) dehydratase
MTGRYAAFTFVDRITAFEPGRSAEGRFHIPAGAGAFPSSLMAEATGQLAAWVAVEHLGFRLRPVAGIAHETIYRGAPRAGDTLHTQIRIDSCEHDAVAYQGVARVGDDVVLELRDCVGPMLPLEDFDDPQAMREFLATLRGPGARVDRFAGVEPARLVTTAHERGREIAATLDVPAHAPYFDDHFPRRPVFPGTLLLDRMTTLAGTVVREAIGGADARVARVTDVKLRTFTEPGASLELRATIEDAADASAVAVLEARAPGQKRAVGAARVHYEVLR